MRKSGNFKLVFSTFCFIFLVSGNYNMLASEESVDRVTQLPEHIVSQPSSDAADNPNTSESPSQYQQAIQEAQDLADLTDLREKALSSQPSAGQGSAFDSKYEGRRLIKH